MKTKLLVSIGAAILFAGAASAQASAPSTFTTFTTFVDNFESPSEPGIAYGGADAAGAIFGNGTGIQQNGSPFGYANTPDGVQTAHIQSDGSFTETVSGLVAGDAYTLSFLAAQRPNYGTDGITVSYGSPVSDPTIANIVPVSTNFQSYSTTFIYDGSGDVFTIAGTTPQGAGAISDPSQDYNAAIDRFSVSAVPEPSTWALMILGIGGIGLAFRQAKRKHGLQFKDCFAA